MRLVGLIVEDGSRNNAYITVLAASLDGVLRAGSAQHDAAYRQLLLGIAAVALLLAASGVTSVFVARSITRPLDQLAEQATLISEGELTDVVVSGPREVQTVARRWPSQWPACATSRPMRRPSARATSPNQLCLAHFRGRSGRVCVRQRPGSSAR